VTDKLIEIVQYFYNIPLLSHSLLLALNFSLALQLLRIKRPPGRIKKAAVQHKPQGHPCSGPTKCILLKMLPPPDNNQDKDEDDSDEESEEDELYG
jgi:hypothetical protein